MSKAPRPPSFNRKRAFGENKILASIPKIDFEKFRPSRVVPIELSEDFWNPNFVNERHLAHVEDVMSATR